MRFEARAVLHAGQEQVWKVLSDWEGQASWMPDVAWVRVQGYERGLGARVAVRTKVLGVPLVTDELRVVAWEPPRRMVIEHRGVVRGAGEWLLEPAGERTSFIWRESMRMPPPLLGDLALWVYSPVQRGMLRRSMRNLDRLLQADR
jgi:carbon monoxide dehydrogenase subunit G